MSVLINNLAGGAGPSPLLASARNATALLTELEGHISAEWDRLAPEHTKQPPLFCLGDALYHRHAGWAFVIGQAEASEETKVRVYRQNSASEIKVTVPFYFNVTRASQADTGISGWLKKLDESVNT